MHTPERGRRGPQASKRGRRCLYVEHGIRIVVGACIGLLLVYWVAGNVLLKTRLFRRMVDASPEQLWIEYSSAYTIIPGTIHVDGLTIRGSDSAVQWILRLDRCDFHVHALDLLHEKFHAGHIRASGVSMRIRLRLKEGDATPEVVSALPPVPGFSDPPYLEIGPPTLPVTDENYHLWTIQLDDVDARNVREVCRHSPGARPR
jgi:hypothetical protein